MISEMGANESILKKTDSQISNSILSFGSTSGIEFDFTARYPYSNTPLTSIILKFTATTQLGCDANSSLPSYVTVTVDTPLNVSKENADINIVVSDDSLVS